jgi:hypothetical protein
MKVRALTQLDYGDDRYNEGDVFTATPNDARELIEQGLVEAADAPESEDK